MAETHSSVPDGLTELLAAHLPFSLPILRRLQFTNFNGGLTATSRIIVARTNRYHVRDDGKTAHLAVAYLDFSRGPETEMWMYSTLENGALDSQAQLNCEEQIVAVIDEAKRESREYDGARAYPGAVVIGSLHPTIREVFEMRGIRVKLRPHAAYQKWLVKVDELPDEDVALPEGMRWAAATDDDYAFILSRTSIPRKARTLSLLPSLTIKAEDGVLVAWSFLGPDGSLSSLHCEEPFRRRGLARKLATKLFRERLGEFGADGWCAADVAPDNVSSAAVCKALNAKPAWEDYWVWAALGDGALPQ